MVPNIICSLKIYFLLINVESFLCLEKQKYKTVLNCPPLIENGFKCTNPDYLFFFACFRFSLITFLNFARMPSFTNNKAEAFKERAKKNL